MLNDPYLEVLHQFIQVKHRLHIVEVGANDGKLNDPIYEFCIDYSEQTDILLVEPNPKLLLYLEENYQTHPSYEIANCAIGDQGFLTLHVMKEEAWPEFQPEYADAWPIYRAPTG